MCCASVYARPFAPTVHPLQSVERIVTFFAGPARPANWTSPRIVYQRQRCLAELLEKCEHLHGIFKENAKVNTMSYRSLGAIAVIAGLIGALQRPAGAEPDAV